MMVPVTAAFFRAAELVVSAGCFPFACTGSYADYLKGRPVVVTCPRLEDLDTGLDRLTQILRNNDLTGIEVLVIDVPCCRGLVQAVRRAREMAGAQIPLKATRIGVRGNRLDTIDL